MMETKHTPGPWSTEGYKNSEDDFVVKAGSCHEYEIGTVTNWKDVPEEAQANARLIAAAPDLLEAVIAFIKYDGSDHEDGIQLMVDYNDAQEKCIAAFAKATGA